MATILNDRDVMMRLVNPRFSPPTDRGMFLYPSSAVFKVVSGASTPTSYTFEATLLNLEGTVEWSATAGATLTVNGNSATLTFANMTIDTAIVTATITVDGTTYTKNSTVSKVVDGAAGTSPNKTGTAYLWKWAPSGSTPSKPTNSSTFTWSVGANTAYGGADGWSVNVPANPGTPGLQLFGVAVGLSVAATATTTTVSYASSTVTAWSQNGNDGLAGASGVNSGEAVVFKWAATIPSGPSGTAQFTWSNGTFGAAPSGWGLTPGTAPSKGMTLWAARVFLTDTADKTQSDFNWTSATIRAVGYSGSDGTGTEGASYVTAYCASVTPSTTTAPANTSGRSSVPAANGGGIVGAWTKTVPTLTAGQFLYQSDGIYDPATNTVVWSIPYWSSLKVATLSAIIANLGVITGGEIHIGSAANSWHVNPQGDMWSGSDTYATAPFRVSRTGAAVASNLTLTSSNGTIMFDPTGLKSGFEAPGTKNSEQQWGDVQGIPYEVITNNDDSVALGFNPSFATWTGTLPNGWGNASSSAPIKETTIKRLGNWSVKYVCDGATNHGIQKRVEFKNAGGVFEPLPEGTFLSGTIDMYLQSIVSGVPQIIVRLYHTSTMNFPYTDTYVRPAATADMWQRLSFKAKVPAGQRIHAIQFYFFGSYSGGTGHYNGTVMFDNFRFALFDKSIDNTTISIGSDGTLGGAGGGQVTITGLGYSGALDATKGAPTGTMVGGTDAGLVASRAVNGQSAYDAVNHATTGLAQRLSKNVDDVLNAKLVMAAKGAIQLSDDANNTTTVAPSGIVSTKAGKVNYSQSATGAVTMREVTVFGPNDEVILHAGKSLAQQVATNPNLAPTPTGWVNRSGGATGNRNGDGRFGDGSYLWLPSKTDNTFVAAESPPLNIPWGAWYTVSFDAYCEAGTRLMLADLVNGIDWDSTGKTVNLTTTMTRFSFSEVAIASANAPKGWLRFCTSSPGSNIVIANIKVELGTTVTPWCDSIITPDNARNRVFIPNLQALAAYLGSLEIGPGGSIRQGKPAFNSGRGIWIGDDGGTPKMHIGESGGAGLIWDGFELTINRPKLASPFSVQLTNVRITQQINGSTIQFSAPTTITSGSGSYAYSWSFTSRSGSSMEMISSPAAADAVIKATGSNRWLYGYLALTLKDLNSGLTATSSCEIVVQFGSGAEP